MNASFLNLLLCDTNTKWHYYKNSMNIHEIVYILIVTYLGYKAISSNFKYKMKVTLTWKVEIW